MSDWKKYKLGEIADINPRVPLKQGNEYSFVEMKDLDATLKYVKPSTKRELKGGSKFQDKDTLFARITPCLENGKICQVKGLENGIGFGSTEFMVFRGKENLSDTDFIYYLTRTDFVRNKAIQAMTGTSGRQRVEKFALEKIEIVAPDLETQVEIASILSSFDDKIELNLQMNQTLEAMAQAIFKEWFVNFNFPGFDGELVDGLPKGWRIGKLSELINILSGFAFKSADFVEDGEYKLVTIKNVQDGQFDTQTTDKLKSIPEKMPQYCLLSEGDILLSLTGNVGRICIVTGEKFLLNQRVAKLEPLNERDRAFTYFHMRSSVMKERLISISRGTAQQNLSPIETGKLEFVVPDNSVLAHYSEIVNSLFEKTIENINEINTLTQIRDSLLPKLMTGKIEIKE